jgi:IrrE N-terminal-like domain
LPQEPIKVGKLLAYVLGSNSSDKDLLDTKEERLARRLSQKLGVKPPVDVFEIARNISVFEEMRFPIDIDGICLDLNAMGSRPKIWVNKNLGAQRKRFTVAHEIGHVVIPWHTGSIVDDLEQEDEAADDEYWDREREANRFAAELLMPKEWAIALCERADHLRDAMHAISQIADVSLAAAALRTRQLGRPGYLCAGVRDGIVIWSGKTPGTAARQPYYHQEISTIKLDTFEEPQTLTYGSMDYYWWKERPEIPVPPKPEQEWREILAQILTDVPDDKKHKAKQQLNAIVGLPIGKIPRGGSPSLMYKNVLESIQIRYDENPHVANAVKHPLFLEYALARIYERAEL